MFNHITNREHELQTQNVNPKMNMIAVRCSQANETSRHIKTCHIRHIFMPGNETIKK